MERNTNSACDMHEKLRYIVCAAGVAGVLEEKLEISPTSVDALSETVEKIADEYASSADVSTFGPDSQEFIWYAKRELRIRFGPTKQKRCPRCGCTKFAVTAHVTQDWVADGDGAFEDCICECGEVVHTPDDDDLWECYDCGYGGSGKSFNAK